MTIEDLTKKIFELKKCLERERIEFVPNQHTLLVGIDDWNDVLRDPSIHKDGPEIATALVRSRTLFGVHIAPVSELPLNH
jgi:hypothetical protein